MPYRSPYFGIDILPRDLQRNFARQTRNPLPGYRRDARSRWYSCHPYDSKIISVRRYAMRLSIALGVGLISFSSAFAASQADRNACDKASTDPEGIRACTNIIDSHDEGYNRAIAYMNRGVAYGGKGEHDRAIADYDQAIRLNPQNVIAYSTRGLAYNNKGDYDRAIVDFDQAVRLAPELAFTITTAASPIITKAITTTPSWI